MYDRNAEIETVFDLQAFYETLQQRKHDDEEINNRYVLKEKITRSLWPNSVLVEGYRVFLLPQEGAPFSVRSVHRLSAFYSLVDASIETNGSLFTYGTVSIVPSFSVW